MKKTNELMKSLILGLALTFVMASPGQALDTTEVYSEGFSDYELYYRNFGGSGHAVQGTIGAGFGDYLNPSLSVMVFNAAPNKGVLLKNFSTFVRSEHFEFDVYEFFGTTFKQHFLGAGMEFTFPFGSWTPYLQAEFAKTFGMSGLPMMFNLGVAWQAFDWGQFFLQGSDVVVPGANTIGYGLGFNFKAATAWEIITQVGMLGKSVTALAGFIYTMN